MSHHLSEDQFAKCVLGTSSNIERQHAAECPLCSAEFDRFCGAVGSFRSAIRCRVDAHVGSAAPRVYSFTNPAPAGGVLLKWSLALMTSAVVALVFLPLPAPEETVETIDREAGPASANALMDAINLHLLRTMPAPMEPMMVLLPEGESTEEWGGVQ